MKLTPAWALGVRLWARSDSAEGSAPCSAGLLNPACAPALPLHCTPALPPSFTSPHGRACLIASGGLNDKERAAQPGSEACIIVVVAKCSGLIIPP